MKKASVVVMAILFSASWAHAGMHSFFFDDPLGDNTGSIDVVRMDFAYDDMTGGYTIVLTADAASPFVGTFRVNINLFNPDTGTTDPNPSLFSTTFNDYGLSSATSLLTLTGVNTRLQSWDSGDRVATSSVPFGDPDGLSAFKSTVRELPSTDLSDLIAYGDFAVIDAPPDVVPVPGAALLGMLGAGLIGWLRRRRTL